jgi:hypothetical protein
MENILDYQSSKAGMARLTGTILLDKKLEMFEKGKLVLARQLTRPREKQDR